MERQETWQLHLGRHTWFLKLIITYSGAVEEICRSLQAKHRYSYIFIYDHICSSLTLERRHHIYVCPYTLFINIRRLYHLHINQGLLGLEPANPLHEHRLSRTKAIPNPGVSEFSKRPKVFLTHMEVPVESFTAPLLARWKKQIRVVRAPSGFPWLYQKVSAEPLS